MPETYLRLGDEIIYIRHNRIRSGRLALLFLHGLGDSGLTFRWVFDDDRFDDFNLIVLDLVGYGRSSGAVGEDNYAFDHQIRRLGEIIERFRVGELLLIGHSMGGDIATLMCQADTDGLTKKIVNVEGALTQYDLFLSGKAARAVEEGRFDDWFDEFINETAWSWGEIPSGRDYYASLRFCRRDAFRENALEIARRNTALSGAYRSQIGELFGSLKIPRVFCYGTESLPKETLAYVKEKNIPARAFEGSGHCPQIDLADEFYDFLYHFITEGS